MTKRKKRWIKISVLSALALLVAGVGVAVYLIQRPPMMYRQARQVLDQTTEQAREQIRDNVLMRLADLTQASDNIETSDQPIAQDPTHRLQRIDPFGSFTRESDMTAQLLIPPPTKRAEHDEKIDRFVEMELTNEEMVAFVSEIFVDWTIQRGYIIPGGVNDPVVVVKDGNLALAFAIQTPYWEQVFSGDLKIDFQDNGMAVGRVTDLQAGSLPISLSSVGRTLKMQFPDSEADDAERLTGWLNKLDRFEFRPVIELDNRRRARVFGMEAGKDSVTLKLRVQDRLTYKEHNHLMKRGALAVTDRLGPAASDTDAYAEVQSTTD